MKLIRFGSPGHEKPGLLDAEGYRRDLSAHFIDWNAEFFEAGGIDKLARYAHRLHDFPVVAPNERWASCVARPGKVICIGLNYVDHAQEAAMKIPKEPIVFMKAANTVVGPFDPIIIPKNSKQTDWEIEMAVVIGSACRYLESPSAAVPALAGYCLANDVSERSFQLDRGGQWTKGKSFDNFCPLGPYLLTSDELGQKPQVSLTLSVNGTTMQQGKTSDMLFEVNFLIHYLSQFMTLEAGDLVLTGTPPGVGMGMKPPRYLQTGDCVELSSDKLGRQRQVCIPA